MNDLYLKMKDKNFDPASSQKVFNNAYKQANGESIKGTTALFVAGAREEVKKKGWGTKADKKGSATPLGKKDPKKPTPPAEQTETAARGKGYNRENVDTGMTSGAEAGASTVTFGSPSKAAPAEPAKKKYKFE